jgi:hypothetical protein
MIVSTLKFSRSGNFNHIKRSFYTQIDKYRLHISASKL